MANIIFTKNAESKLHQHNLSREIIYDAIQYGERQPGREPGITQIRRQRDFGSVFVVAKKTETGDWLIISCGLKGSSHRPQNATKPQPQKESIIEKVLRALWKIFRS